MKRARDMFRGGLLAGALGAPSLVHAQEVATRADPCESDACTAIVARVRVAGSRNAIPDAEIHVFPAAADARVRVLPRPEPPPLDPAWTRHAVTNESGVAEIASLPPGHHRVIVLAPGIGRYDAIIAVGTTEPRPFTFFVEPDEAHRYRTTVPHPPPQRGNATVSTLSAEEIQTVPGSQGDPLRALQNLPGVARAPGHLGLLVLRGASPRQSRVFVGGHAIPRAFHFLSLSSVFPAEILDSLRLVPGNFDAAYGNATGGIVLVDLRDGSRDGFHGHAEIDLGGASARAEGPLGKGSFIVAAARGYADLALRAADAVIRDVSGQDVSFILPTYYDYQGMFHWPFRKGLDLRVRVFGSGDRLRSDTKTQEGEILFDFNGEFHRVDLELTAGRPGLRARVTPSFRYERNRFWQPLDAYGPRQVRNDFVFSWRSEVAVDLGRRATLTAGADFELDFVRGETSTVDSTEQHRGSQHSIAIYAMADLRLGGVNLVPGVRVNAFTLNRQAAYSVDPRVSGTVELGRAWQVRFGVGRYSQVRDVRESQAVSLVTGSLGLGFADAVPGIFNSFDANIEFQPADVDFTLRDSWQASAGAQVRLPRDFTIEATGFGRLQDEGTPVFDATGLTRTTTLHTRAVGLEVLIRKAITRNFYGWIAYTLLWSQYVFRDPLEQPVVAPSDFDQRHNLVLLASYRLPRGFRIGAAFRLSTSYPFTPFHGSIDTESGPAPVFGPFNGARLGLFHQLDLRVDKRWTLKRLEVLAYFDVQNVYNRVNPEWAHYAPDFREIEYVAGMPIFPTLGVRLDF